MASESAVDRLRAARVLRHVAVASDQASLRQVLIRESDAWVKSALEKIVNVDLDEELPPVPTKDIVEDPAQLERDVRAQTTQELTDMVTHELEPLLGSLRQAAMDEVPSFETSSTYRAISGIGSFLSALRSLYIASGVPTVTDFSLSDLVFEVTETVRSERKQRRATAVDVLHARTDHVAAYGDQDLVRLAFLNILRNAIEASDLGEVGVTGSVVVNWGNTDRDAWIVVFDRGVGLPAGASSMGNPGVTTKEKGLHMGMGLAVSLLALRSMNGTVTHQPRQGGGVVAEMRWSGDDATYAPTTG